MFASSQHVRNTIPWTPVDQVMDWLRARAPLAKPLPPGAPTRLIVVGDDGEKFGLWPGTTSVCWGDDTATGWIEAFSGTPFRVSALEH